MSDLTDPTRHSHAWIALTVVVGLIVYGSLYPFHFSTIATPFYVWELPGGLSTIRDAAINVGMYFPLGFLTFHALRRSSSNSVLLLCGAVGFGFLVSAALEWAQAYDRGRVSSSVDLTLNTIGSGLGGLTAAFLGLRFPDSSRFLRRPVPLFLLCTALVGRLFPFFPRVHAYQIKGAVAHFFQSPFSFTSMFTAAIVWMSFRILLAALLESSDVSAVFALLVAVVPIGMLVVDQNPTMAEFAGAVLSLVIGHWWHPNPREYAPVLVLGILLRELAPFRFVSSPMPFQWLPFAGFLNAMPLSVAITLEKIELYGAGVWFLGHRLQFRKAAITLTILLFALEVLQCYQPGRTPEITDALLVLLAAACLKIVSKDSKIANPQKKAVI